MKCIDIVCKIPQAGSIFFPKIISRGRPEPSDGTIREGTGNMVSNQGGTLYDFEESSKESRK